MVDIYYELKIATSTALWYHSSLPVVPLRWVLVRDPLGKLAPKAFLCMADALHARGELLIDRSAWYEKPLPTFSDALASVRMVLWRHTSFSMSDGRAETLKIPRPLFERLTSTLAYAA
jgi:hypothetical protein